MNSAALKQLPMWPVHGLLYRLATVFLLALGLTATGIANAADALLLSEEKLFLSGNDSPVALSGVSDFG